MTFAILSLAAFFAAGCPKKTPPVVMAGRISADNTLPAVATQATFQPVATAEANVASTRWIDLKDYTYDNRAQFFAGLEKLEAQVDEQIQELNAKRATLNSTVDTKDWDFAMKEMGDARVYLKSTGEELRKADPETWNQRKDKVGRAWMRTQDAYGKVKASTTIL